MITSDITELLKKYKAHTLTCEEFEELQTWLKESDENRRTLLSVIRYYKIEERWDAYCHADTERAWKNIAHHIGQHRRRLIIRRIEVAAACVAVLVATSGIVYHYLRGTSTAPFARLDKEVLLTTASGTHQVLKNGGTFVCIADSTAPSEAETSYNTISTQAGGNFKLVLPDHTSVWLNANTTLRYPTHFSKQRSVQLQGEAFFDVTHNGSPFVVSVRDCRIQVLGTQFNISAYSSRVMTATLVRGKVEVSNHVSKSVLTPGTQAVVTSSEETILTRHVDTSIYTSWITGVFDFRSEPLGTIMDQLAEWYNIDVEYESTSLRNIRFSGSIYRDRPLDYSLDIIEEVSDVRFMKKDGKLVVMR
jgi:transmembrane sensor